MNANRYRFHAGFVFLLGRALFVLKFSLYVLFLVLVVFFCGVYKIIVCYFLFRFLCVDGQGKACLFFFLVERFGNVWERRRD